jgi:hypothetical protein
VCGGKNSYILLAPADQSPGGHTALQNPLTTAPQSLILIDGRLSLGYVENYLILEKDAFDAVPFSIGGTLVRTGPTVRLT